MFLVTIAPATPVEKPSRVVCKDEIELIAEIRSLSQTADFVSYLVERVTAYGHTEDIELD